MCKLEKIKERLQTINHKEFDAIFRKPVRRDKFYYYSDMIKTTEPKIIKYGKETVLVYSKTYTLKDFKVALKVMKADPMVYSSPDYESFQNIINSKTIGSNYKIKTNFIIHSHKIKNLILRLKRDLNAMEKYGYIHERFIDNKTYFVKKKSHFKTNKTPHKLTGTRLLSMSEKRPDGLQLSIKADILLLHNPRMSNNRIESFITLPILGGELFK